MDPRLKKALARCGGVVRRDDVEPIWALHNAARRGQIIQLYPGVYVSADDQAKATALGWHHLRAKAALRYLRDQGSISHTTALVIWQLRQPSAHETIHVSVPRSVRIRGGNGLMVHHRRAVGAIRRSGLIVTTAAQAIVDSWPHLPPGERIGLVLNALDGRLATPGQIRDALARQPKLTDIDALRQLLTLSAAGCRSPLEVWGAMHVFKGHGFAGLRRQVPVKAGDQWFYLDLYAYEERVNFELDGAAWHGSAIQRERDLRRDAALATLGILVVRFSYARLTTEPEAVRREALAILASRR